MKKNIKWTLISLEDFVAVPGTSIKNVLHSFLDILEIHYVLIDNIEGAGSYEMIHDREFPFLPITKFLEYLPLVSQFNWADFYFFQHQLSDIDGILSLDPMEIIMRSDTTIRAVDQTYIYVYTPFTEVADRVKNCGLKIDMIKENDILSLDYPE